MGQRSFGPIAVVSFAGVLCHLPKAEVLYPYSLSTSGKVAAVFGMMPVYPSNATARSAMVPAPTRVWLRPVSSAARVGEQIEVVWKALYRIPCSASSVRAGVCASPPNVSVTPNPMSSIMMTTILGASAGKRCGAAGHFIVESSILGLATLSEGGGGNGSTDPSLGGVAAGALGAGVEHPTRTRTAAAPKRRFVRGGLVIVTNSAVPGWRSKCFHRSAWAQVCRTAPAPASIRALCFGD